MCCNVNIYYKQRLARGGPNMANISLREEGEISDEEAWPLTENDDPEESPGLNSTMHDSIDKRDTESDDDVIPYSPEVIPPEVIVIDDDSELSIVGVSSDVDLSQTKKPRKKSSKIASSKVNRKGKHSSKDSHNRNHDRYDSGKDRYKNSSTGGLSTRKTRHDHIDSHYTRSGPKYQEKDASVVYLGKEKAGHLHERNLSRRETQGPSSGFMERMREKNNLPSRGSGKMADLLQYKSKKSEIYSCSDDKSRNNGSQKMLSSSQEQSSSLFESSLSPNSRNNPSHIDTIIDTPLIPLPPHIPDSSSTKTDTVSHDNINNMEVQNTDEGDVDDPEYAHLLLEYSQIKNSLNHIYKEEESSQGTHEIVNSATTSENGIDLKTPASTVGIESYNKKNDLLTEIVQMDSVLSEHFHAHTAEYLASNVVTSDRDKNTVEVPLLSDKTEVIDMELESTDAEGGESNLNVVEDKKVYDDDDDDDLDILELRRAALASAALSQKKRMEQDETTLSVGDKQGQQKSNKVGSRSAVKPAAAKRKRLRSRRQHESRLSREEYEERDRLTRERERILREKERLRREDEKLRRAEDDLRREKNLLERDRNNRREMFLTELRDVMQIEDPERRYNNIARVFDLDSRTDYNRDSDTLRPYSPEYDKHSQYKQDDYARGLSPDRAERSYNGVHKEPDMHYQENINTMAYSDQYQVPKSSDYPSQFSDVANVFNESIPFLEPTDRPFLEPTHSIPFLEPTHSIPFLEPRHTIPFLEPTHTIPFLEPTHSIPFLEPTHMVSSETIHNVPILVNEESDLPSTRICEEQSVMNSEIVKNNENQIENKDAPESKEEIDNEQRKEKTDEVGFDDEDEELLRAHLLASLAQKRRKKEEQKLAEVLKNTEPSLTKVSTLKMNQNEQRRSSPLAASTEKPESVASSNQSNVFVEKNNQKIPKETSKKLGQIPKHKPVIINFDDSSSDDQEAGSDAEEPPSKISRPETEADGGFTGTLDSFLKDVRASVERKQYSSTSPEESLLEPATPTPKAVKHLGPYHEQEYRKLKEEIRKRESKKRARKKSQSGVIKNIVVTIGDQPNAESSERKVEVEVETKPGNNVASFEVTDKSRDEQHEREVILVPNRISNLTVDTVQKNIMPLMDIKMDENIMANQNNKPVLVKDIESKVYVENSIPRLEDIGPKEQMITANLVTNRKVDEKAKAEKKAVLVKSVRDLELKTTLQRKFIEQDQQRMDDVKKIINKKKMVVKTAEQKIQKIREQMQAAQKIFKSNIEQISKLNEEAQVIQGRMDDRRIKFVNIQKEMTKLGVSVYGQSYKPGVESKFKSDLRIVKPSSPSLPKTGLKPDVPSGSTAVNKLDTTTPAIENSPVICNMTPKERTDEKKRLEMLEQQLGEMIRIYKDKKTGPTKNVINAESELSVKTPSRPSITKQTTNTDKSNPRRRSWVINSYIEAVTPSKPEHVETQETMLVSISTDSEDEEPKINPKRRSLLGNTQEPITKPNILCANYFTSPTKDFIMRNSSSGSLKDDSCSSRESSPGPSSKIIATGQYVNNLAKYLTEGLSQQNVFTCSTSNYYTSSVDVSQPSFSVIPKMKYLSKLVTKGSENLPEKKVTTYSGHLLRFRSYRFSPYFRTKFGFKFTSKTHSNRVKNGKIMCRFDLTGKCNDSKCLWQHFEDHDMGSEELLQDLVSYAPELGGISVQTPPSQYQVYVSQYAELFLQKNAAMTTDQQCILLASQVNEKSKHIPPHTTHVEARKWKPISIHDRFKSANSMVVDDLYEDIEFTRTKVKENKHGKLIRAQEDILNEQDVRYWMLATDESNDMESAVMENPQDTNLWLKFAYKKLHSEKGSGELGLDLALNVLSKALEANKTNSDLWYHYLVLYEKKKDHRDFIMLFKQALNFAPSYTVYWKYLILLSPSSKKIVLCEKIQDFLCKQTLDSVSNDLLEVTLYQIQLLVIIGNLQTALQKLQDILKNNETITSRLSKQDLVILWLCYVHLFRYEYLPNCLFDPTDGNPGCVVNKDTFVIPWDIQDRIEHSSMYQKLNSVFQDALLSCTSTINGEDCDQLRALFPLYENCVLMHLHYKSIKQMSVMCNEIMKKFSTLPEAWVLCSDVYCKVGDVEKARELLEKVASLMPLEPKITYALAMLEIRQTDDEAALELLELSPFHFFQIDISDTENEDPSVLLSILLRHSIPLLSGRPELKKQLVDSDDLKKCNTYLWLNYCMMLELQGFKSEVVEAYESALSTMRPLDEVKIIWKIYLFYVYKQLEKGESAEKGKAFCNLVHRCLISMPSKRPIKQDTSSGKSHWLDYSFHNEVVHMLICTLTNEERTKAYEDLLKLLPANVELLIQACQHFYNEGHIALAFGHCTVGLEEHPKCSALYRMYFYLANELGKVSDLVRMHKQASVNLPHCKWLMEKGKLV